MKVCYFGTYETDYPRNRIIINGLRKNNVKVIECNFSVKKGTLNLLMALKLFIGYFILFFKYLFVGKHDVLVVGYLGHFDMFLAKLL